MNPYPLQWKHGILATELPRKSLHIFLNALYNSPFPLQSPWIAVNLLPQSHVAIEKQQARKVSSSQLPIRGAMCLTAMGRLEYPRHVLFLAGSQPTGHMALCKHCGGFKEATAGALS